jgi:DNA-binding NarL/FixJ family response regulator
LTVPVAVSHPVATYRRGLVDALRESGFVAGEPSDLFAWASHVGRCAVIISLASGTELDPVARLQQEASAVVVVLLADPSPRAYREVLSAGAFPVAWDVPPAGIVGVLQAAINGQVLVPQGVATGLAWHPPSEEAGSEAILLQPPEEILDETEVQILARIARGDTDRRIASALKVSERTVRRRLQIIFLKLGVETRVQAGIHAVVRGLTPGLDVELAPLPGVSRLEPSPPSLVV